MEYNSSVSCYDQNSPRVKFRNEKNKQCSRNLPFLHAARKCSSTKISLSAMTNVSRVSKCHDWNNKTESCCLYNDRFTNNGSQFSIDSCLTPEIMQIKKDKLRRIKKLKLLNELKETRKKYSKVLPAFQVPTISSLLKTRIFSNIFSDENDQEDNQSLVSGKLLYAKETSSIQEDLIFEDIPSPYNLEDDIDLDSEYFEVNSHFNLSTGKSSKCNSPKYSPRDTFTKSPKKSPRLLASVINEKDFKNEFKELNYKNNFNQDKILKKPVEKYSGKPKTGFNKISHSFDEEFKKFNFDPESLNFLEKYRDHPSVKKFRDKLLSTLLANEKQAINNKSDKNDKVTVKDLSVLYKSIDNNFPKEKQKNIKLEEPKHNESLGNSQWAKTSTQRNEGELHCMGKFNECLNQIKEFNELVEGLMKNKELTFSDKNSKLNIKSNDESPFKDDRFNCFSEEKNKEKLRQTVQTFSDNTKRHVSFDSPEYGGKISWSKINSHSIGDASNSAKLKWVKSKVKREF